MATPEVLQREEAVLAGPRGMSIEKKIETLENLTERVSNRRSRSWLNDRLLIELVPRLNEEEIRGLFAPPPWGDDAPLSVFCKTNFGEWDKFRNIDMDKEAIMIEALKSSLPKRSCMNGGKAAVLDAWYRVDIRTRNALRQSYLYELINRYEESLMDFIKDDREDVLVLHVQDPFHRLLLHGVCEFYNLVSVSMTKLDGTESRMTKIKKTKGSSDLPQITLSHFLKMCKEGIW